MSGHRYTSLPAAIGFILLSLSCTSSSSHNLAQEEAATPHIGFPVLPPVKGADPSIRRPEIVARPTKLILRPEGDHISIAWDEESFEKAGVTVGHKMILGHEERTYILKDGKREYQGLLLGSGEPAAGTSGYLGPARDSANKAGSVSVEVDVTVFETDIPPQHFWRPREGKFRVLAEWTVKGEVRLR